MGPTTGPGILLLSATNLPHTPNAELQEAAGSHHAHREWRQEWARTFNVGVILGHGLQWFGKKFRRYADKANLFLQQLWYWLGPSGSLCSLKQAVFVLCLVFALPKARRGDESQTSAETVSPEATFELSIIFAEISSTQPVFPGPLPHPSSSGPTCGWEVGL